ncbi:uncharacterized protein PAC_03573 [Phialocephala subalpina]|uniref:Uncharacterized protein n=1 Tax=Phialocephala subalpina TaxID=576137 RepID=A0A1L7WLQ1_9HELO|nr:uncharacterized protein PAC_03573 [Phialocephala subalpina]
MSDTEMNTSTAGTAGTASGASGAFADMPQGDVDFIMACIQNANDGVLTVDAAKIAANLGYNNVRSVGNRLNLIKKKYGLAISASAAKKSAVTGADADASVSTPTKTPKTPNKVVKTPKTPRTKATPTPAKTKKTPAKKSADADTEMGDAEHDEEEGGVSIAKDEDDEAAPETPTKPKKAAVKKAPAVKKTPAVKKSPAKKTPAKKEVKSKEKVVEDLDEDMEEAVADLSVKATGEEVEPEGDAE